jgi:hypothetical protein
VQVSLSLMPAASALCALRATFVRTVVTCKERACLFVCNECSATGINLGSSQVHCCRVLFLQAGQQQIQDL